MTVKRKTPLFLLVGLFSVLVVFFQGWETFSLWGVNPNLILVLLLSVVFLGALNLLLFAGIIIVLAFLFLSNFFWVWPFVFLIILVAGVYFIRPFLFGKNFMDFLIMTAMTSIIFSLVSQGIYSKIAPLLVVQEALYNIIFGIILWSGISYVRAKT